MGKARKPQRPMKGFSKIAFSSDGAPTAVACASCGKFACFCKPGAVAATALPSPALSALSVSLKSEKSPTFGFTPISGYGNTDPPPFDLGGPSNDLGGPDKLSASVDVGTKQTSFFDGGSPTWVLDGSTFALTVSGVSRVELRKLIERHGGLVSNTVHAKVDLVVATERAVRLNTQFVRKARDKFGIPLVTPAFVLDTIAAGEWQDVLQYEPKPMHRDARKSSGVGANHTSVPLPGFKWKKVIRKQLERSDGGVLPRKRLRELVLSEYAAAVDSAAVADQSTASCGACDTDSMRTAFRIQLRRAARKGRVLVEQGAGGEGRTVRLV